MPRQSSKPRLLPITALTAVSLALTILTGCQSTSQTRIEASATQAGKAQAGVNLAPLPDECRKHVDRVLPQAGEKWRWVQAQWSIAADEQDRRTNNCADFYDNQRNGLAK